MIKRKIVILLFLEIISLSLSLPVNEKKKEDHQEETKSENDADDWELNLEYGRYLKEVVQALENDPEFRKKLESANVDDIKSGKISRELHLVDHNVRTKLDELKRRELERLRHIAVQEHEKKTGVDRTRMKIPVHVDHRNPERFESEDLRKLILQLNTDLERVDKERESEFKKYELEKEYQYKHELEGMDEEHKTEAIKKHEEEMEKHKKHPKLHHPGSKQQLEEVWEEQDHMQPEDFDPATFFHLHDLDGNGVWDEMEVKALFQKELDKMYDPNAPEDDLMERYEEMERMREHVFGETDENRDNLISYDEFLKQAKSTEFERDDGWQGLDEKEFYSQQEYEEYERQKQIEIQQLIESGAIPPPPGYHGINSPQVLGQVPNDISQGYHPPTGQGMAQNQVYQVLPQGHQVVPPGYQPPPGQAVPVGYQAPPLQAVPQGQGYHVPQGQVYQAAPQYQAVPQAQAAPQYQAAPIASAVPHPDKAQAQFVPQAQAAVPHAQDVPQAQVVSQAQAVPQGPAIKVQDNQVGGQVPQKQYGNINEHPEIKPVVGNQLPGSN